MLAERTRRVEDCLVVKNVLEKVFRVVLDDISEYDISDMPEYQRIQALNTGVVWTRSMRRLFQALCQAFRNHEPVLLVGDTGSGKTTVCSLVAQAFSRSLRTVNAHQNTEAADLLGSQRPVRDRLSIQASLQSTLKDIFSRHEMINESGNDLDDQIANFQNLRSNQIGLDAASQALFEQCQQQINQYNTIFEWTDGPLVEAMKRGEVFLLDEISLAEDAVLERFNSILEPGRSLVLAEKASESMAIIAHPNFLFCATMNPGGDFGKKELSPALRNRFTEIWVPALTEDEDFAMLLQATLSNQTSSLVQPIIRFSRWFCSQYSSSVLSAVPAVRDLLSWAKFCNSSPMSLVELFVQGAALTYIDGVALSSRCNSLQTFADEKVLCVGALEKCFGEDCRDQYPGDNNIRSEGQQVMIGPYPLLKGDFAPTQSDFHLNIASTRNNALRVVRAMSLRKPILLEGSPGVGKSSLIMALANHAHRRLIRINLSEQTDLVDLFGADVPDDGASGNPFVWREAPFLTAMRQGHWVLLDEMNLATQSVLEGLNACLDHRAEVFVPEINRTFGCHAEFRVFAAQNPYSQGGGRKGLPKSFINRFTTVFCDSLTEQDLQSIVVSKAKVDPDVSKTIVDFVGKMNASRAIQKGSWSFNLRDILRWLEVITSEPSMPLQAAVDTVFYARFRTQEALRSAHELKVEYFGPSVDHSFCDFTPHILSIGRATMVRDYLLNSSRGSFTSLRNDHQTAAEACLFCIKFAWPCILSGPTGVGKSTLITDLACLLGKSVDVISLSPEVDSADLLGTFEQRDESRVIKQLLSLMLPHALRLFSRDVVSRNNDNIVAIIDLIRRGDVRSESLSGLLSTIEADCELSQTMGSLFDELRSACTSASTNHFQWYEGKLVRAVREGKWLILDNANLCDPAILDRLNALLEPGGTLVLPERIQADGTALTIVPHKDFRIFLLTNPTYGELSPAMRNRGLEIHINPAQLETNSYVKADSAELNARIQQIDCLTDLPGIESKPLATTLLDYSVISTRSQEQARLLPENEAAADLANLLQDPIILQLRQKDVTSSHLCTDLSLGARTQFEISTLNGSSIDLVLGLRMLREIWQPDVIESERMSSLSKREYARLSLFVQSLLLTTNTLLDPATLQAQYHGPILACIEFLSFITTARQMYSMAEYLYIAITTCWDILHSSLEPSSSLHIMGNHLSDSSWLQQTPNGLLFKNMWTAFQLRPLLDLNAMSNVQILKHNLFSIDKVVQSSAVASLSRSQEQTSLKLSYLYTIRDTCIQQGMEEFTSGAMLPAHTKIIQEASGIPSDISAERPWTNLFRQIYSELQLSSIATFNAWKAHEMVSRPTDKLC